MEWLLRLLVDAAFSFLHQIVSNQIQSRQPTEHHLIINLAEKSIEDLNGKSRSKYGRAKGGEKIRKRIKVHHNFNKGNCNTPTIPLTSLL